MKSPDNSSDNSQENRPESINQERIESYKVFADTLKPGIKVVYHPASEYDVSPSKAFPDARVIYVDIDKKAVEELQKQGHEAHYASASEPITSGEENIPAYKPDVPVDLLIFQNAAMPEKQSLESVKEGGYVLANDHLRNASTTRKNTDFELIGRINFYPYKDGSRKLDTSNPDNYFIEMDKDEELAKIPQAYEYFAKIVEEKTGKRENIVDNIKKMREEMAESPVYTNGMLVGRDGRVTDFNLPSKKGTKMQGYFSDDIYVFRKKIKILENKSQENLSDNNENELDLRKLDGGKFIFANPAEGSDIHELEAGDFKMPVSFTVKGGHFRINGKQDNEWAIISGTIAGDIVKINHIELAEELRGAGVGKALLADLEEQFKKQGVKTAYATFAKKDTVEFFLKNNYKIIPMESLAEQDRKKLVIDKVDFDARIGDENSFNELKETEAETFRKILLKKEIINS